MIMDICLRYQSINKLDNGGKNEKQNCWNFSLYIADDYFFNLGYEC